MYWTILGRNHIISSNQTFKQHNSFCSQTPRLEHNLAETEHSVDQSSDSLHDLFVDYWEQDADLRLSKKSNCQSVNLAKALP